MPRPCQPHSNVAGRSQSAERLFGSYSTDANCCSVDAAFNGMPAGSTAAGEAAEAAVSRKKRDSRLYAAPKPAVRTNEALTQSGSFLRTQCTLP